MWDSRIADLAGSQFNRVARIQLLAFGLTGSTIDRWVACGRLVAVEEGVFALPPLLAHDEWGRWIGATLTAPGSVLSHLSAAAAWGFWSLSRAFETITRPGSGGPRRHGGVKVHRSSTLAGESDVLRGIPITSPARTLLDLANIGISHRALARAVREAIRLGLTSIEDIADCLARHGRRRGVRRLRLVIARYSGLPLSRARSGAEVRAMEILRAGNRSMPNLNFRVANEEADLSWPQHRLIIEIDGGPFHLDAGEDERKEACWARAGWRVERLPSDDIYERPDRLLALAPPTNVPESRAIR